QKNILVGSTLSMPMTSMPPWPGRKRSCGRSTIQSRFVLSVRRGTSRIRCGQAPDRVARTAAPRPETIDVERVFREVYGQAVATPVRVFGDITLAEDAVQDAFVVALDRWRAAGVPPNPAGWIVTTARHRAIDRFRRSARGQALQEQLAQVASTPLGPGDL